MSTIKFAEDVMCSINGKHLVYLLTHKVTPAEQISQVELPRATFATKCYARHQLVL